MVIVQRTLSTVEWEKNGYCMGQDWLLLITRTSPKYAMNEAIGAADENANK